MSMFCSSDGYCCILAAIAQSWTCVASWQDDRTYPGARVEAMIARRAF
jgi:hypothetical protein